MQIRRVTGFYGLPLRSRLFPSQFTPHSTPATDPKLIFNSYWPNWSIFFTHSFCIHSPSCSLIFHQPIWLFIVCFISAVNPISKDWKIRSQVIRIQPGCPQNQHFSCRINPLTIIISLQSKTLVFTRRLLFGSQGLLPGTSLLPFSCRGPNLPRKESILSPVFAFTFVAPRKSILVDF